MTAIAVTAAARMIFFMGSSLPNLSDCQKPAKMSPTL